MSRRAPGRATRQILSGSELARPSDPGDGRESGRQPVSIVVAYFMALGALVVLSAFVWALWGMGPASVLLFLLALGLIASWLVV